MAEPIQAYIFVDGAYVRERLRDFGVSDRFDPIKPASLVQNHRFGGKQALVGRVFYYDAPDTQADASQRADQEEYFSQLRRLPDTHVVLGEVRKGKKREQKGVDVQLAIDALKVAVSGVTQVIALVSGDADFAPLARAIRETGPHVLVFAFSQSAASSLLNEADKVHLWDAVPQDWELKGA